MADVVGATCRDRGSNLAVGIYLRDVYGAEGKHSIYTSYNPGWTIFGVYRRSTHADVSESLRWRRAIGPMRPNQLDSGKVRYDT